MSVRRLLTTTVSFAGSRVIALATGLVLAKLVGPVAWGAISTIRGLFEMVLAYLRGGSEQLLYRHAAGQTWDQAAQELHVIRKVTLTLAVPLSAGATFALLLTAPHNVSPNVWTWAVLLVALSSFLLSLAQFNVSASVACGSGRLIHAENLMLPVARFLGAVALLLVLPPTLALAAGFMLAAVTVLAMTWSRIGAASSQVSYSRQFNSLGINYVLTGLMSRLDVTMIGMISGLSAAGPYAVVHSLGGVSSIIGATHGRMLAPRVGHLLRTGRRSRAHHEVRRARRWALLVTVPTVVATGFAYHLVMAVLGAEYETGPTVIWPILGSYGLLSVFSYGGLLLSLDGKQSMERVSILSYAASMGLGLVATLPTFGLQGAALTCLVSSLVLTVHRGLLVASVYKSEPRLLFGGLSLPQLMLIAAPAVVAMALLSYFGGSLVKLFATIIFYAVLHFVVMYRAGLAVSERRWLRQRLRGFL